MAAKSTIISLAIVAAALISIGFMWTQIIFHSGMPKQDAGFEAQSTLKLTGIDNTPCILYLISYSDD